MKYVFLMLIVVLKLQTKVFSQAVNESPEGLYKWSMPMEVNGVEVFSTKPAKGYVVLQNGERLEGLLKLKKSGGMLTAIHIKSKKKKKLKPDDVKRYGLQIRISDVTENGKKNFNNGGKKFKESKIFFKDGRVVDGYLAFQSNRKLFDDKPEGAKDFYVGYYFTPNKADFLTAYPSEEIKHIVHGGQTYFPIQGGFVKTDGDGDMGIALFQKGILFLKDSSSLSGEIKQQRVPSQWYADTLHIRTAEGETKVFGANSVSYFTQVIDEKERGYRNIQNVFVEVLFEGVHYDLYRNPFPSENKLLNTLAKSATVMAADQIATQQARKQFKNEVKDAEGIGDIADSYSEAKQKQLETFGEGVEMSQDISIKKKEYILHIKETHEELIMDKNKYKRWLKREAPKCSSFIANKLKAYAAEFANIAKAVQLLDECY